MKEIIRSSIKLGIMYAAIGVACAVAAPPFLALIGIHIAAATLAVAATVSFEFALFGVLVPVLQPFFSFIFGKDSSQETNTSANQTPSTSKDININIQQTPPLTRYADIEDAKFARKIEADRSMMAADNQIAR